MKRMIMLITIIIGVVLAMGCTSPMTPTPTPVASPTLIGGSDEAHIQFIYGLRTYSDFWGQKASPGKVFYIMHANITSDKPVECTPDWFYLEYKAKDTGPLTIVYPVSNRFSSKTIQNGVYAQGEIEFELPTDMAPGYPKPVFWMPVDRQTGPYKVKQPVYGSPGAA